jgi:glutaredoxin
MTKTNHKTILYSRDGCHLCEVAEQLLIEHGLRPENINIDDDPALVERFNTCVPVVEIDGKIRFRGRVDAMLLKRLLR